MEGKLPCAKHEEQIKTLFKQDEALGKRVDNVESMKETLIEMKLLMGIMVEHSKKQDIINEKQNETLNNVNNNLISMNQNLMSVDKRVGTLETRVDDNENKHLIDNRDIAKERDVNILKKYGFPFGAGIALGTFIIKLIKIFI